MSWTFSSLTGRLHSDASVCSRLHPTTLASHLVWFPSEKALQLLQLKELIHSYNNEEMFRTQLPLRIYLIRSMLYVLFSGTGLLVECLYILQHREHAAGTKHNEHSANAHMYQALYISGQKHPSTFWYKNVYISGQKHPSTSWY